MKLVILGLAAIALLGGGAAGAYFFLNKPAEASAPMDEVKKAADKEKTAKAEGEAAQPTQKFVKLEPMIFPVINDSGVVQSVSLVVSLEVADDETAKKVDYLSPRLKDAYIQDMYGQLNQKSSMVNGVISVEKLKERLNRVSEKVLGPNVVNDVLLQVVQQRRV